MLFLASLGSLVGFNAIALEGILVAYGLVSIIVYDVTGL